MRAHRAERGPGKNRKGDAILRAGVAVEEHRNQHNQVAEGDRADRLPPVHPAGDQAAGEHVGGNADRHPDPEVGDVKRAPAPFMRGNRGQIAIIERTVLHRLFLVRREVRSQLPLPGEVHQFSRAVMAP